MTLLSMLLLPLESSACNMYVRFTGDGVLKFWVQACSIETTYWT